MARGPQKPLDERIQAINDEIQELEDRKTKIDSKISELKEKREPLLNEQKLQQLEDVQKIIESTGLTPEEIIARLSGTSESA